MLRTKTINNQNAVTDAVLGLDEDSTTTINGNTTLNTLTVNGVSNFNTGAGFNSGMQIRDTINNTFSQIYHSGPTLTINTWTANSRIRLNTVGATAGVTFMNLLAENGNRILIQGQDGQGIDILNNQIAINGITTFNNTVSATTFTGNLTGTASSATNSSTIFVTNSDTALTRYPIFTDGVGNRSVNIDITTGPLTYIPNTGTLTATTFNGNLTGTATTANNILTVSDTTDGTYHIPFIKTSANASSALFVDDVSGPLTYNPSSSTIKATTFNGALTGTATTANNVAITENNNSSTFYIPFCSAVGTSQQLFVDSVTNPLSYNPSFGQLICSFLTGDIQMSSGTNTATFSGNILTIDALSRSFRNFTINFTGTTNTIANVSITSIRNNGLYNVAILNTGSGNLTINTSLGGNIRTTYSSAIIIAPSASALMTINVITLNGNQTIIVDVKTLIT